MPQLDPATFPPQLIWLAITFIALYFLMSRVALPRVSEVLEERQERIADDLDRAGALKAEADAVIAAYEAALAQARDEAHTVLRQTADKLAAEAAARQAELTAALAEQEAAAERRIDQAKEQALRNLRTVAAEVAQAATARLIGVEVDRRAAEQAVAKVADGRVAEEPVMAAGGQS